MDEVTRRRIDALNPLERAAYRRAVERIAAGVMPADQPWTARQEEENLDYAEEEAARAFLDGEL